jgi:prephenate dehydratase
MADASPATTPADASDPARTIAFQGALAAYSDLACRNRFPGLTTLPCGSFEDLFEAVTSGRAAYAMIPIENSIAGRVADIHRLIPDSGLKIIGEHFERVRHQLLVMPGVKAGDVKTVHSHVHALGQCGKAIRRLGAKAVVEADTAGSAAMLAEGKQRDRAVIASSLAADIYGLEILERDIEDADHNTTRFVIMTLEEDRPAADPVDGVTPHVVTSFIFRVRNIPAALYKAMGGFATNGINMTKLESYMVGGDFVATQFYADVEGHPDDLPLKLALEELEFFAREVRIMGVYPAHPYRYINREAAE